MPEYQHKTQVNELLSRMTLEEKLAQIVGVWTHDLQAGDAFSIDRAAEVIPDGIGQISRIGGDSTLHPLAAARFANQVQAFLVNRTRLGIPAIVHEEVCAGLMTLGSTIYPQMLGLAASFLPDLAEKMTDEIRKQTRAVGAHQGLAPVLDVARDPRWGRCEETFGEDPLLISRFGVAYIRGLQTNDLAKGVMATGKHFIGHSLSQGGLNCNSVHVGWRELWDVFMLPFQAAIQEAGIASVMNAYPDVDGEVVAASRRILTDILRDQLGFTGLVVSDYEAIPMLNYYHRMVATEAEAGEKSLIAGIDVELPTRRCYGDSLKTLLTSGELSLEYLDTAVCRVLDAKFTLGLFDTPYVNEDIVMDVFETPAQRQLARHIAEKTLTLLKNDGNILPLNPSIRKLAVIGPNADNPRAFMGDYSYTAVMDLQRLAPPPGSGFESSKFNFDQVASHQVHIPTLLASLKNHPAAPEIMYARGCDVTDPDQSGFVEAVNVASSADAILLVLGDVSGLTPFDTSGETRDSSTLRLPAVQEALLDILAATGKPIILVLVSGRVLALTPVVDKVNAILDAWVPGEEGGAAITAALLGEVTPGGKLPITFPRSVGQLPVYYNHRPSSGKSNWYGPYVTEPTEPLFPFGHGLSYTSFEYSNLILDRESAAAGEVVNIHCTVKNTGSHAGDEVVQLYCSDQYASSPRPVKELKGFARLTLAPGESKTLHFELPVDLLAHYDDNIKLVVEPGGIDVLIGSSSKDIRLSGRFTISGTEKQEITRRLFNFKVQII